MKKFLGNLRVIVEAEDWDEAFSFLDELTKAEIAAYDAKILTSNIDSLKQSRANRLVVPGKRVEKVRE